MKRKGRTGLVELLFVFGGFVACYGGETTSEPDSGSLAFGLAGAPSAGGPSTIHACQIQSPTSLEGRNCCCNDWCGKMHPWTNPRVPPNYYKCYR